MISLLPLAHESHISLPFPVLLALMFYLNHPSLTFHPPFAFPLPMTSLLPLAHEPQISLPFPLLLSFMLYLYLSLLPIPHFLASCPRITYLPSFPSVAFLYDLP